MQSLQGRAEVGERQMEGVVPDLASRCVSRRLHLSLREVLPKGGEDGQAVLPYTSPSCKGKGEREVRGAV